MNLAKCGSWDIYSVEYKCTKLEIEVTTISITQVRVSKRKPQLILAVSVTIHGVNLKRHGDWFKATS